MNNNKYKVLVLSDFKKTTYSTLKSGVSLAKMIDAEIELFHVKKHIDIVESDNQLSALRVLNEEHNNTEKKIKTLINSVSKEYNITIKGNYSFGNVKEEIRDYLKENTPDIIVIGQRESSPIQLIGDGITRFVLKEFKGIIMISANENALEPNKKMTLGVLNDSNNIYNNKLSKDLLAYANAPLRSFKVIDDQNESTQIPNADEKKTIEYVFEQTADVMTTISSYLLKHNINLLYIDRVENNKKGTNDTSLKEVINKLNVSLLLSEAS
ncbi:universal stress protein [Psychroserpens damuponensis]|uniref:universal stress protein n=1 Tax=Psychroserpens damuponensis TaxID=943936 RepID=UPI000590B657|nr:universal stress protein [Psychroserpens damuponensis]